MLKKTSVLLLSSILLLLSGCSYNKSSTLTTTKELASDSIHTTDNISSTGERCGVSDCTLFVNSKDITNGNYVKINYQDLNTEIPLLAILEELGAEITWNNSIVTIEFEETKFDIDTTKEDFGLPIPPGTTKAIRKVINNEIIIDGDSAQGLLLNVMGAKISVDYDDSAVYIDSMSE